MRRKRKKRNPSSSLSPWLLPVRPGLLSGRMLEQERGPCALGQLVSLDHDGPCRAVIALRLVLSKGMLAAAWRGDKVSVRP